MRLEERFVIDGRAVETRGAPRRASRDVQAAVERLHATRRARGAADVLRVHDGHRVRAVPARSVSRSPCSKSARRPARRHQRRHARSPRPSRRSTSITRRSSATRSRRSRGEKAGIIKPGIPVVCGPRARRGGTRHPRRVRSPAARRVIRRVRRRADRDARSTDGRRRASRTRSLDGVRLALPARISATTRRWRSRCWTSCRTTASRSRRGDADGPDAKREWPGAAGAIRARGRGGPARRGAQPGRRARAGVSSARRLGGRVSRWCSARCATRTSTGCSRRSRLSAQRSICTTAPSPRALPAAELAEHRPAVRAGGRGRSTDPAAALERALALGRPIVVAGSIFLDRSPA